MALSERLNTPISDGELNRRWRAVRAAMEREKIDVLLIQNNNDHMGGYVRYFTDMPATNGYPNTVVFPRSDEMTVVCQGPFGGSEPTAQADTTGESVTRRDPGDTSFDLKARLSQWRGVKEILTTPSYASAHYEGLRPRARRQGAQAFRQGHHRLCRYLSDVVCDARLHQAGVSQCSLRRCFEHGRLHQGDQERRGDGARQARGADAGRRHARGLCGGEAGHARHRSGRGCAILQSVPWQRERHLSLRLDAARHAVEIRQSPCAKPRHPEGRPDCFARRG